MKGISALLAILAVLVLSACGGGGDRTGADGRLPLSPRHPTAAGKKEPHRAPQKRTDRKKKKKAAGRKTRAPLIVSIAAHVEYRHFSRADQVRWMTAFEICNAMPEERLAQAFQVQGNLYEIGHAYGREYTGSTAIATEEGCMTALQGSESEREAYLASEHEK